MAAGWHVVTMRGRKKHFEDITDGGPVALDVDDHSQVVLRGWTPLLEIRNKMNGQSHVDCSGLMAKEVHVKTEVDGQVFLSLHSTGKVFFDKKIDGQSAVIVRALGDIYLAEMIDGQCLLMYDVSPWATVRGASYISGESAVFWRGVAPQFSGGFQHNAYARQY